MHRLKMIGIAAIAAMALTALVGVGSASATEVCTVNTSPCPSASMHGPENHVEATSNNVVLTTSGGIVNPTVTCTGSTITGTQENTGKAGEAVGVNISTFDF